MKITKCLLSIFLLAILSAPVYTQTPDPDNVAGANLQLTQKRLTLIADRSPNTADKLMQMLRLGMWEKVEEILDKSGKGSEVLLLKAHFDLLRHRYHNAQILVDSLMQMGKDNYAANLLDIRLKIEAWQLSEAERACSQLLRKNQRDAEAILLLGKVNIFKKNYTKTLALAQQLQEWEPSNAKAWLMAAEAYFWQRDLTKAEEMLRICLQKDPFLADARYYYGYAIWRRRDASQLQAMADQWQLALEINPMHYLTHWHWGNGHTHLTYADYVDPQEKEIRKALAPFDSLISIGKVDQALNHAQDIEKQFPASILPGLYQASAYYMAYDKDLDERLDTAELLFQRILNNKAHFGPAHNGLAAVIKMRQMHFLSKFDSLEQIISQTQIVDTASFYSVFSRCKILSS